MLCSVEIEHDVGRRAPHQCRDYPRPERPTLPRRSDCIADALQLLGLAPVPSHIHDQAGEQESDQHGAYAAADEPDRPVHDESKTEHGPELRQRLSGVGLDRRDEDAEGVVEAP
jgi:hypothetical protein